MLGLKIFKLQTLYELVGVRNDLLKAQAEREEAEDEAAAAAEEEALALLRTASETPGTSSSVDNV